MLLLGFLPACQASDATREGSPSPDPALVLATVDDVVKAWPSGSLLDVTEVGAEHVLLQIRVDQGVTRYLLKNRRTGQQDILPLPPFGEARLERAVSADVLTFRHDGRDSDGPFTTFPYRIHCLKISEDTGIGDDERYQAVREEIVFPKGETVSSGSKDSASLRQMTINRDTCTLYFGAEAGQEAAFYADATDIPITRTRLEGDDFQLVMRGKADPGLLMPVMASAGSIMKEIRLEILPDQTVLHLRIAQDVSGFRIRHDRQMTGTPFLEVQFLNDVPSSEEGQHNAAQK